MCARAPQAKKLFCQGKTVKECLSRKTAIGVGWNKYLDLCMTRTPILQLFFSLLPSIKRGPNWFKHTRGEYRIAKILKFRTAKSERTTTDAEHE